MTAVSSSSVSTVSNVAGLAAQRLAEASRCPRSATPPPRSAVITTKCSQPSACLEPGVALLADRQLGGALEAEVRLRVRVAEVVGHLPALEQHVERHDRGRRP